MVAVGTWNPGLSAGVVEAMNAIADELGEEPASLNDFKENTLHPEYVPAEQLFVAMDGQAVVGYCDGWLGMYGQQRGTLAIGVLPSWRCKGIGSALLARSCEYFSRKCGIVQARVPPGAHLLDRFLRTRAFVDQSATMLLRCEVTPCSCETPPGVRLVPWHTFGDKAAFRQLHNTVFADVPNWRPITEEAMGQYTNTFWFQGGELNFVIRGQLPIAWLWMSFDADESVGYIESLGVIAGERRRGLGSFLLGLAQRLAAQHACRYLELSVEVANARALGIYRRTGFTLQREYRWLQGVPHAVLEAIRREER